MKTEDLKTLTLNIILDNLGTNLDLSSKKDFNYSTDWDQIFKALKMNTKISSISFDGVILLDEEAQKIAQDLKKLSRIEKINFGNTVSSPTKDKIKQIYEKKEKPAALIKSASVANLFSSFGEQEISSDQENLFGKTSISKVATNHGKIRQQVSQEYLLNSNLKKENYDKKLWNDDEDEFEKFILTKGKENLNNFNKNDKLSLFDEDSDSIPNTEVQISFEAAVNDSDRNAIKIHLYRPFWISQSNKKEYMLGENVFFDEYEKTFLYLKSYAKEIDIDNRDFKSMGFEVVTINFPDGNYEKQYNKTTGCIDVPENFNKQIQKSEEFSFIGYRIVKIADDEASTVKKEKTEEKNYIFHVSLVFKTYYEALHELEKYYLKQIEPGIKIGIEEVAFRAHNFSFSDNLKKNYGKDGFNVFQIPGNTSFQVKKTTFISPEQIEKLSTQRAELDNKINARSVRLSSSKEVSPGKQGFFASLAERKKKSASYKSERSNVASLTRGKNNKSNNKNKHPDVREIFPTKSESSPNLQSLGKKP